MPAFAMHELAVIGNGLAGLIVAAERADRGQPVLLLSDGRAPGGHFAGLQVEGQFFDIGMVLLEQVRQPQPPAELSTYDPARRNDWTRFGTLASDWLQSKGSLCRTPTPEVLMEGRRWPDYLIANRLDAFADVACPAPEHLPEEDPRHARQKIDGPAYDGLSYAEAGRWNHGPAWHARFLEPWVRKLTGTESAALLARHHRAAWLPLYYPRTLRDALQGRAHGLAEYPFWCPTEGTVASWVSNLVQGLSGRIRQCDRIAVDGTALQSIARDTEGWSLRIIGGPAYRARHVVLATTPERACELLSLPAPAREAAASLTVLLARVRSVRARQPSSCLMVLDESYATTRVTSPDLAAGRDTDWLRVAVEARPEAVAARYPGLTLDQALAHELAALWKVDDPGSIVPLRTLTARDALPLPTPGGLARAAAMHQLIASAAPSAALTGTLLGYGTASINDQIVQALGILQQHRT